LPWLRRTEPYFAGPSDYEAHGVLCVAEGAVLSTPIAGVSRPEHRFDARK
jgi:hypothetical protein